MTRRSWALLALPLLVSCNESPTALPPSAGTATLVAAQTSAQMSLNAMTAQRHNSHQFSETTPWTSAQPVAQFDEVGHVAVQDDGGDASSEASLECWTSVGTADGVALRLSNRFEIDARGSANRAGRSSARMGAWVIMQFQITSDVMHYELFFDHDSGSDLGGMWSYRVLLLGPGGGVINELQSGAELSNRTLVGTLPSGLYEFRFSIERSSNWSQGTTPAVGDAWLWFAVK